MSRKNRESQGQVKKRKNIQYSVYVEPKTENQAKYIQSMKENLITLCSGPAGSGKSFLALATALNALFSKEVEKIYIVRPLVALDEYGENKKIAALQGGLYEKIKEYLMGVFDSANILISEEMLESLVQNGNIQFLPLSMIRGRSLHRSFIILEEAQNLINGSDAMKTFMTRIGQNSKMVIAGDIAQSDLGKNTSALGHAMELFKDTPNFGIIKLEKCDIQRNGIIGLILDKYEQKID